MNSLVEKIEKVSPHKKQFFRKKIPEKPSVLKVL